MAMRKKASRTLAKKRKPGKRKATAKKKTRAKRPKKKKTGAKRPRSKPPDPKRRAAALKGWETRRTNERKRKEKAARRKARRQPTKRAAREPVIPPDWRRVIFRSPINVEMMAAQVAERIQTKVIGVHDPDSYEAQIILALIAAEQTGTFNSELYDQAGLYPEYDTAGEVYTLWLYSGN